MEALFKTKSGKVRLELEEQKKQLRAEQQALQDRLAQIASLGIESVN